MLLLVSTMGLVARVLSVLIRYCQYTVMNQRLLAAINVIKMDLGQVIAFCKVA